MASTTIPKSEVTTLPGSEVIQVAAGTISSKFGFTNTTAGTSVNTTNLMIMDNYGKTMDEPTEARLVNKTCPLDQGEVVSYRCRDIKDVSTFQQIMYPARVREGIEFGVRVDELLRTEDSNGLIICDEPIVATLTIRCPKSSNVTSEVINEVVNRLLGACFDQTAKEYRWDSIMRSSLVPTQN